MELLRCIVNELITHYAYKLIGGNTVFVYENGSIRLITLSEYYGEIV
ncbi:hypothetical protein HYH38_16040 [Clostridium botulinum]|uniref:Uncharacterized protein n=1 Tax=Clostridium botulinum TaxID=1491 RepID=A0A126JHW8_CLOBO|nr:hypothetical protein [Clostridium botulinum]ALT05341.1 hypothetical protein [Clostridium botulinum]MBY6810974.1 hypothetical protein [Clostridium botulinum]MBY6818451.1 hypothetical protein [Clostridium botulinum]MBY6824442.1 hypothetical protein [Clostridium botulinum]MBY6828745.1 hypothetical protein [Clostridium botulinum]